MFAQRRFRSVCEFAQFDLNLRGAFCIAKDAKFLNVDNEDSDQTARMRRLIWVFFARKCLEGTFSHVAVHMVLAIGKLTWSLDYAMAYTESGNPDEFVSPQHFDQSILCWYTFNRVNPFKHVSAPFWKGVYSKKEEFAPRGSKFFPFRADHFLESPWCAGKQTGSHKSVSLVKMV